MHNVFSSQLAARPGRGWLALVLALCTILVAFGVFSDVSPAYAASSQRSTQALQYSVPWHLTYKDEATSGNIIFYNGLVQIGGAVSSSISSECATVYFASNEGRQPEDSTYRPTVTQQQNGCISDGTFTFGFTLKAGALNKTSNVYLFLTENNRVMSDSGNLLCNLSGCLFE